MAAEFVDSNVLVYAFTLDERATMARAILLNRPATSVQGLNEFANVARRKLGMDWRGVRESLGELRLLCSDILPLDIATHDAALRIAEQYGYRIFDSLILASALQARSETLWSEDMQHGMVIGDRLRIVNPFRKES